MIGQVIGQVMGQVIGQVMGQVIGQVMGQVIGQVTGQVEDHVIWKRGRGRKMKNRLWIVTYWVWSMKTSKYKLLGVSTSHLKL